MLGPFATASRLTPIHQGSLAVLSRTACASMSTTSTTTTTTTRDRVDRYGPMEWAQLGLHHWPTVVIEPLRWMQNGRSINDVTSSLTSHQQQQPQQQQMLHPASLCCRCPGERLDKRSYIVSSHRISPHFIRTACAAATGRSALGSR